jgi:hypothetical protein
MLGQIYEMSYGKYYYIGKHDGDIFEDEYFGSGIAWTNVVKKYGKENIQRKILKTYDTKEQADILEKFYIKQYKEKYDKNCLNIADGGQGGNLGEEVNKKISEAVSGEGNGMYGKKLSEETRTKISKKLKGHPNYNYSNYRPTEEIKAKISKSHIGIKQTPESIAKIKEARAKQTNLKLDSAKGKHWYTDGVNNVMCFEENKPDNYYLGRTIIKEVI